MNSTFIACNIWRFSFKFNCFINCLGTIMQYVNLYGFFAFRYEPFLTFLLIDATDRSKVRSNETRIKIGIPLFIFAITPFKYFSIIMINPFPVFLLKWNEKSFILILRNFTVTFSQGIIIEKSLNSLKKNYIIEELFFYEIWVSSRE